MANITITELEELKVVKPSDSILVENETNTFRTTKESLLKEVNEDIKTNAGEIKGVKDTVDGMKDTITENTHENIATLNSLGESANLLTYKGKVVVNNNEYSFKTLPRKKAPVDAKYISCDGGRLPWQE